MALNTNGLMSGFLDGWQTMANYQHQQKQDALADKADQRADNADKRQDKLTDSQISLAEAQKAHQNWLEQNTEHQQKVEADHWGQDYALRNKQTTATIATQNAQVGLDQQRLDIQKKTADLQDRTLTNQITAQEQQKFAEDNWGLITSGYQAIAAGKPITEQQAAVLNDPKAGAFNINKYTDPNYVQASQNLSNSINGIMKDFKPEDFHSPSFYQRLNSPEIKRNANILFHDEINRGLGQTDATGKVIAKKELAGFTPLENGGIAIDVIPTYADGTKGKPAPITVNRSSDPNDQVSSFAPSDLAGVIHYRANLSNAVSQQFRSESLLQDLHVIPGRDPKGYAQQAARIDADTNKNIAQIRRNAVSSGADPAEIEKQIADERAAGEQQKSQLMPYYGLTTRTDNNDTGNTTTLDLSGGGQGNGMASVVDHLSGKNQYGSSGSSATGSPVTVSKPVAVWASDDPNKLAYLKQVYVTGKFDPLKGDVANLDANYNDFRKASTLEQAALRQYGQPATTPSTKPATGSLGSIVQPHY